MAWVLQCPSMSSEIAAPLDCCHVLVPAFLAPLRGSFCRLRALIILGQGTPCREAYLSPLPSSMAPHCRGSLDLSLPSFSSPQLLVPSIPAPAWRPEWPAQSQVQCVLPGLLEEIVCHPTATVLCQVPSTSCFLSSCPELEGWLSNAEWILSRPGFKYFRG